MWRIESGFGPPPSTIGRTTTSIRRSSTCPRLWHSWATTRSGHRLLRFLCSSKQPVSLLALPERSLPPSWGFTPVQWPSGKGPKHGRSRFCGVALEASWDRQLHHELARSDLQSGLLVLPSRLGSLLHAPHALQQDLRDRLPPCLSVRFADRFVVHLHLVSSDGVLTAGSSRGEFIEVRDKLLR